MRKRFMRPTAMVLALAVLALCLVYIFKNTGAYASTEESAGTVKVFVGDVVRAPGNYKESRHAYIKELAETEPAETVRAVIGLDRYYTLDEVSAFVDQYADMVVDRLHMWPEGETGRLSLYVEDGNIEESIKAYIERVDETGLDDDPQSIEDHARFLNGEYGVFALTVTCSAGTLDDAVQENACIAYADMMYHQKVEEYAEKRGKSVYYIELPSKPDGAA